jgi:hypothetical protein
MIVQGSLLTPCKRSCYVLVANKERAMTEMPGEWVEMAWAARDAAAASLNAERRRRFENVKALLRTPRPVIVPAIRKRLKAQ